MLIPYEIKHEIESKLSSPQKGGNDGFFWKSSFSTKTHIFTDFINIKKTFHILFVLWKKITETHRCLAPVIYI